MNCRNQDSKLQSILDKLENRKKKLEQIKEMNSECLKLIHEIERLTCQIPHELAKPYINLTVSERPVIDPSKPKKVKVYITQNDTDNPEKAKLISKKILKDLKEHKRKLYGLPEKQPYNYGLGNAPHSRYDLYMTEFHSARDKLPPSYANWEKVHSTGTDENLQDTYTKRQVLPRKSVSSGIGHISPAERQARQAAYHQRQKDIAEGTLAESLKKEREMMSQKDTEGEEFKKHTVEHADS